MNSYKSQTVTLKVLMALFTVLLLLGGTASADLTMNVNHDRIKVDFFYHGSTVSVSGESDPGTDLVVKIVSPDSHQKLKKKGKAAGFLWMNVGDLNIEHTPNLYFLHSSGELDEILSPEEMDKNVIGYTSVKNHADISPVKDDTEKSKWFNEFIKLKESNRLYNKSTGNISITQENGRQKYYLLCDWPYEALPGDYLVTVYAIKDKKVVDKTEAKVLVEQVGIVKSLYDLANNRGGLYGILAIIVALGSGFGVAMIFGKGGGAH